MMHSNSSITIALNLAFLEYSALLVRKILVSSDTPVQNTTSVLPVYCIVPCLKIAQFEMCNKLHNNLKFIPQEGGGRGGADMPTNVFI